MCAATWLIAHHFSNPHMARYILGESNCMHIIDVEKTVLLPRRALVAVTEMYAAGSCFLWMEPRDVQKVQVGKREARKTGTYTAHGRWIRGILTNPSEAWQAASFQYRPLDCDFGIATLRHMPPLRAQVSKNCNFVN